MKQWVGLAALAALAGCGGGSGAGTPARASAASAAMQPGLWETTTTITRVAAPGMPAGVSTPLPPPTTVRHCLTPEQARQPAAGILSGAAEDRGCTTRSRNIGGGRVRVVVQCRQNGQTTRSIATSQFAETSFEVTQQVEAGGMQIESRSTGRRIGDCEDGASS